jgi:hypothetical protein
MRLGRRNILPLVKLPLSKQLMNLGHIDLEIRSVIVLLNRAPYLRTSGSCSGHPATEDRKWIDGWIAMQPVGDPGRLWDFLNALTGCLDSTSDCAGRYYPGEVLRSTDHIRERFRRAGVEALYDSCIPVVGTSLHFAVVARRADGSDPTWERVASTVRESGAAFDPDAHPTQHGAHVLPQCLANLPFVRNVVLWSHRGKLGVEWEAMGDRESCSLAWQIGDRIRHLLDTEGADATSHFAGSFVLKPIVRAASLGRTRADHLAIWRLIEMAAQELLFERSDHSQIEDEATAEEKAQPWSCHAHEQNASEHERSLLRSEPAVVQYVDRLILQVVRAGSSDIVMEERSGSLVIRHGPTNASKSLAELPEDDFSSAVAERICRMAGIRSARPDSVEEGDMCLRIPALGIEPLIHVVWKPGR